MIHGILNIYKEKGYTSFDVVAKLRGILKTKKIGHTGTLDPDAEGVLPVCVGKATKVCDLLTDKNKEYEAVMLLGKTTDTQDCSGTVLSSREVLADETEVRAAILEFIGDYMQIPPMYSALKVDGHKLCDLAREGITVKREARPVHIFSIEILEMALPRVKMRIACSKGTYIRTLCHDIGENLGCGACMESLVRTKVSSFLLKDSLKLSEIEQLVKKEAKDTPFAQWHADMFSFVKAVDIVFLQYEKAVVKKEYEKFLYNGNRLFAACFIGYQKSWENDRIRVYDHAGNFIGIYQFTDGRGDYKPIRLFLLQQRIIGNEMI